MYCTVHTGSCGSYSVEECSDAEPGTKVVCHLKVEDREFADEDTIKSETPFIQDNVDLEKYEQVLLLATDY